MPCTELHTRCPNRSPDVYFSSDPSASRALYLLLASRFLPSVLRIPPSTKLFFNPEPLAELNKTVTPVISAVQMALKNLDSGPRTGHFRGRLRRNDVEGLLQEGLLP